MELVVSSSQHCHCYESPHFLLGQANDALSFAPDEVAKTIAVTINGDALVEGEETFFVFLSGSLNATINRARGIGIITNDDTSG